MSLTHTVWNTHMQHNPSFAQVRNDLVAHIYALAFAQDQILRSDASALLLGVERDTAFFGWPAYGDFDLSRFKLGRELDTLYRYAFAGELLAGIDDESEEGNLGWLVALQGFLATPNASHYLDEIRAMFDGPAPDEKATGLAELARRASARLALDHGDKLTLADLALLADMDERSVRNALHAKGSAGLIGSRSPEGEILVDNAEANRWLAGRRGFRSTVWVGSIDHPGLGAPVPDELAPDDVMPFIRDRLATIYRAHADHPHDPLGIQRDAAAQELNWTRERLDRVIDGSIDSISPDDCPALSRAMYLDATWLTTQVMRAKFPEAMTALKPAPGTPEIPRSALDPQGRTLDAPLTDAGIRNGYVDLPRRFADQFFPADAFGSRGGDQHGVPVELHHDQANPPWITDMRVKSAALVSPRKRLTAYFNAHRAAAGDLMRFHRTGERTYRVEFVRQAQ